MRKEKREREKESQWTFYKKRNKRGRKKKKKRVEGVVVIYKGYYFICGNKHDWPCKIIFNRIILLK